MKAKLVIDVQAVPLVEDDRLVMRDGRKYWPSGTVLEDERAYRLVQMGVAVPDDAECHDAAGMTEAQMQAAQHAQKRVAKGIHPDDYEAFDAGEMTGYDEDGNPVSTTDIKEIDEDSK